MLITCAGLHGTGKTTIAKIVAERLGLDHCSTGMVFREMAKEQGLGLVEFSKYAMEHPEVDKELDERMRRLGLEGNIVLDGQLCWFFLNEETDWKVLLTCDDDERVRRIYSRESESVHTTIEAERENTFSRERIEQERYRALYGVDLSDQGWLVSQHDIVIDTTNKPIEAVVEDILDSIGES